MGSIHLQGEKQHEIMLVTSISSFSHNVFYLSQTEVIILARVKDCCCLKMLSILDTFNSILSFGKKLNRETVEVSLLKCIRFLSRLTPNYLYVNNFQ